MSCLINPYIYESFEAGAFVMKINTDGGTNYTMGINGTYDCVVDWGDGTSSVLNTSGAGRGFTHSYPSTGEYIITISGDFPGLYQFNIAQNYKNMIKDVLQWGDSPWGNGYLAFYNCKGIGHISALDSPNFSTTSLQEFFHGCSLTSGVAHWDVSNITNMTRMFENASRFNEDLSSWCVSNIVSEPPNFSRSSPLSAENKPKWGTCPVTPKTVLTFTGGVPYVDGIYTYIEFKSSGNLIVSGKEIDIYYLVVAGGAGGGGSALRTSDQVFRRGGGGGAGGRLQGESSLSSNVYTVIIGAGGRMGYANTDIHYPQATNGTGGGGSSFNGVSTTGGGYGAGGKFTGGNGNGGSGGSGGGAAASSYIAANGGAGIPGQGTDGSSIQHSYYTSFDGGKGGSSPQGVWSDGSNYAGGGNGGTVDVYGGNGGASTGNGGGGGGSIGGAVSGSGNGGSGIVIVRYKTADAN